MPIDINELREYKGGDPAKYRKYMEQRFKPPEWVDDVVAKDEEWRVLTKQIDDLKKKKNWIQKEKITPKKKANEDCTQEVTEMKGIAVEIKEKQELVLVTAQMKNETTGFQQILDGFLVGIRASQRRDTIYNNGNLST